MFLYSSGAISNERPGASQSSGKGQMGRRSNPGSSLRCLSDLRNTPLLCSIRSTRRRIGGPPRGGRSEGGAVQRPQRQDGLLQQGPVSSETRRLTYLCCLFTCGWLGTYGCDNEFLL